MRLGKTTSYHSDSMCLYLPINGTHEVLGVVGIVLKDKIDSFEKKFVACDIGRVWYGFREGNDSFRKSKD